MKKRFINLLVVATVLAGSSTMSAQVDDKAIFRRVFESSQKTDRPFKHYFKKFGYNVVIIVNNDDTETEYFATKRIRAVRTNFEGYAVGDSIYVLQSDAITKGVFKGLEDEHVLLATDDGIKKFGFREFDYLLKDIEEDYDRKNL